MEDLHSPASPRAPQQEALKEFILSFVQALLRAGYYLPGHPQAKRAKEGLHQRFRNLFTGRHELTFMLQDLGEATSVLVEGALPEPQKLGALMPAGMAEVYAPRLAHFLERKDLVSLTLKESMAEDEFSRFIDVMSEPGGGLDAAGKEQFLEHLRRSGITSFSLVFREDLIAPERRLPWRAQLAVSRLKKDLKHVPMFHNLDAAGLRSLRQQIMHEVLRPIARADLLAAILMNSDLAASQEVPPEEIEEELVQFVPDPLVLPSGKTALQVLLAAADTEAAPRQRRALLKLLLHRRAKELPGLAELIRDLFERGIVEFDQLPPALKATILLERDTDRFLAQRATGLKRLEEAMAPDAYRGEAHALLRLVPELLRRNLVEEVLALATTFTGHAALGGPRAAVAEEALDRLASDDLASALKEKFVKGKKEERLALGPLYQVLGERARPHLLRILEETQDGWVRKNACEVLLRMGPGGTEAVLAELVSGRLSAAAVAELLMVFGELRSDAPAVRQALLQYTRDRDPRVREEAAWALCRIAGAAEQNLYLHLLNDPDIEVRRRALRCLRAARCGSAFGHAVALISRVEEDPSIEPLEPNLYAALPDLAEAGGTGGEGVEEFLVDKLQETFPHGVLASLRRPRRPLSEDAFLAVCDALGAMGTRDALETLEDVSKRVREPARLHVARAIQRIRARKS
jgi:hypothetical protein